jgi:hypothetical protein
MSNPPDLPTDPTPPPLPADAGKPEAAPANADAAVGTPAPKPRWVGEAVRTLVKPSGRKLLALSTAGAVVAVGLALNALFTGAGRLPDPPREEPPAVEPKQLAATDPPAEEARELASTPAAEHSPAASPGAATGGDMQIPEYSSPRTEVASGASQPAASTGGLDLTIPDVPPPSATPALPAPSVTVDPVPSPVTPAPLLPPIPNPEPPAIGGVPAPDPPIIPTTHTEPASEPSTGGDRPTTPGGTGGGESVPVIPPPPALPPVGDPFPPDGKKDPLILPGPDEKKDLPVPEPKKDPADARPAEEKDRTSPPPVSIPPTEGTVGGAPPQSSDPPATFRPAAAGGAGGAGGADAERGLPPAPALPPPTGPATPALEPPTGSGPGGLPLPQPVETPPPPSPLPVIQPGAATGPDSKPDTPSGGSLTLVKPASGGGTTPPAAAEPAKTTFDVDLHYPKANESYESISKLHYGDARYAEALRAFNLRRGLELGRGVALEVPPMYVLRRQYPQLLGPPRAGAADPGGRVDWTPPPPSDARTKK